MAEVTIGTPRSRTEITPEGTFAEYYEVPFFIADAEYSVRIPAEEFSAEVAEAKIREKASELLKIKDKVLTL